MGMTGPVSEALERVLQAIDTWTTPAMVRRRSKKGRATFLEAKRILIQNFPVLYELLEEPQTLETLLKYLPAEPQSKQVVRWIVSVLCQEVAELNPAFGYRTRGLWVRRGTTLGSKDLTLVSKRCASSES